MSGYPQLFGGQKRQQDIIRAVDCAALCAGIAQDASFLQANVDLAHNDYSTAWTGLSVVGPIIPVRGRLAKREQGGMSGKYCKRQNAWIVGSATSRSLARNQDSRLIRCERR